MKIRIFMDRVVTLWGKEVVAELIGCSPRQVANYTNGRNIPPFLALKKISEITKISLDDLEE